MEDLKKKILSCMADVIKQNGFRTEFFEAENGQQPMTRVELSRLGKVKQDVIVDMWFPQSAGAQACAVYHQQFLHDWPVWPV